MNRQGPDGLDRAGGTDKMASGKDEKRDAGFPASLFCFTFEFIF
jgi:hypothetical protein